MADTKKPETNEQTNGAPGLGSLSKVAQIPIVECTLNKASEMYSKLKGASETVNSVLTSAENTVKNAAQSAQPVTSKLEGPIQKVDSMLCSGIDFVEEKIPAIKLPPAELAQKTKEALNTNVVEPAMKGMSAIGEYGKQTVASLAGYNNNTKSPSGDSEKK
ncbi:lipid storage droplets surface-binding protein 2 [Halyomorpha halys]|uniref:lipid storage droplets surface-binding protein 2 n=1 Tax=Halyomorpha halys TaxID=286706 RepID=UPI0006D52655|nr:lipid storage droplets surface-binding protein 1-like [Halyomorpha halys]